MPVHRLPVRDLFERASQDWRRHRSRTMNSRRYEKKLASSFASVGVPCLRVWDQTDED